MGFNVDEAPDCKTAYSKTQSATLNGGIDLVFLDISLPPDADNKLYSGEHLGLKMKELLPDAQIKECEFRYACPDNRIPEKMNEIFIHKTKCNYDPLSVEWK